MSNLIYSGATPIKVVKDQLDTLRTRDGRKRIRADMLISLYVLPLLFGLGAGFFGDPHANISSLLSAVAVYTGLVFNLAFQVFDKSLSLRADIFFQGDSDTITLVDQLFASVNYTVAVGVLTTSLLVCATFFTEPAWFGIASDITTGLVAFLLAHLFIMSGMIINRFRSLRLAMRP